MLCSWLFLWCFVPWVVRFMEIYFEHQFKHNREVFSLLLILFVYVYIYFYISPHLVFVFFHVSNSALPLAGTFVLSFFHRRSLWKSHFNTASDSLSAFLPSDQKPCLKFVLTHWGRVTHICVVKLTIIGSDNGLSPGRRQAIIWTNAEILLIGPLGTNFIEMLIGIQTFSFKKMHLKMSSAKCCSFHLGLNLSIHMDFEKLS